MEDLIMNIKLSFNVINNIKIIDNILYSYNIYPGSTFHSHISTLNYDERFFRELLLAIPIEYQIIHREDLFYHVYNLWSNHCGYKYSINQEWEKTKLNNYILENYKDNQRILKKFDYKLIKTKNKIIRFVLILLKKITNHLPFKF